MLIRTRIVWAFLVLPVLLSASQGAAPLKSGDFITFILDDAGPAGLPIDEWNDKARENGLGAKRRMTLMDCRKALKDKGLVHSHMDRWHVTHR